MIIGHIILCSWKPIIDHIDSKYDEYLNAESRVTRGAQLDDHRIHCCLYFITPSGHGLVTLHSYNCHYIIATFV